MARYKVLQSVAHSLAHSFTSTLNWGDADYVMGNLLRRAREVGLGTLTLDLMSGDVEPDELKIPAVERAAEKYADWLRRLVKTHGSDMHYVASARLRVQYDLSVAKPARFAPTELESPYVCTAGVTDDRGKMRRAELHDWWCPEPRHQPKAPSRRWWQFWKPAA